MPAAVVSRREEWIQKIQEPVISQNEFLQQADEVCQTSAVGMIHLFVAGKRGVLGEATFYLAKNGLLGKSLLLVQEVDY